MKLISSIWVLVMAMFCFCGCIVQSLHPYYTAEAVIEAPVKKGAWTMIKKSGKPAMPKPWVFENDKITIYDDHGACGIVNVVYFKVEETIFIDAIAGEPCKGICTWWAMHLTPVHTICRVEIQNDSLTLSPINYEWIEKKLKERPLSLPHLERKDEDFLVFTASAQEWMVFLKKHRNDSKLFSETHALKFIMQNKRSQDGAGTENPVKDERPTSNVQRPTSNEKD